MGVDPERLLFTRHAEAVGVTQRGLSRGRAAGDLSRVRRGVHVDSADWEGLESVERFRYRLHALAESLDRRAVFSHWAAALLLGLPVQVDDDTRIDITVEPGTNRAVVGVRAHALPLDDEDLELVDGLLCTSWARTVVDLAASVPFRDAVVVADAALHAVASEQRPAAKAELEAAWGRAQPRRAVRKVREVLDFADGDSGSVAESHSRVSMRVLDLPVPVLQHRFRDRDGFVGDTDFWFRGLGVIGEADGRVKFVDPKMTKGDPGLVFWNEKVREDRLRALPEVRGFARWDFATSRSPRRLAARLARAGVHPLRPSRMPRRPV